MNIRSKWAGVLCLLLSDAMLRAQNYEEPIDKLVTEISAAVDKAGKKKVATVDFTDLRENVTELGRFLSEQISIGLVVREKSFVVVDRANLNRIMAEHKLTTSGLLDPENTKKLGQFSGADALIIGTMTPMGEELVLAIKVVSTDAAEIVGGARAKIPLTPDLRKLLGEDLATTDWPTSRPMTSDTTTGSPDIEKRLREGEARLKKLEEELTFARSDSQQKDTQLQALQAELQHKRANKSADPENWKTLNGWLGGGRKITRQQVLETLGDPDHIENYSRGVMQWYYKSSDGTSGSVHFGKDGHVDRINP